MGPVGMEKVIFFLFGRGFDLEWRGEMRVGVYMSEMGCVMLFSCFLGCGAWVSCIYSTILLLLRLPCFGVRVRSVVYPFCIREWASGSWGILALFRSLDYEISYLVHVLPLFSPLTRLRDY